MRHDGNLETSGMRWGVGIENLQEAEGVEGESTIW